MVDYSVRYLRKPDLDKVIKIEEETYLEPWDKEKFLFEFKRSTVAQFILEYQEEIIGYYIISIEKKSIKILNLTISESYRNCGYEQDVLKKIKERVNEDIKEVSFLVRETHLYTQLILKECGFKCTGILKNKFKDSKDDGFLFVYKELKCT